MIKILNIFFQAVMVLLLNFWAAVLVTLSLATLVLQLLGTMALLGVKLSAVPAVLLVLAIGRGVHFTVHLCLVSTDSIVVITIEPYKIALKVCCCLFFTPILIPFNIKILPPFSCCL